MDQPNSNQAGTTTSGVGVLDKTAQILAALELGPQNLSELTEITAMPRPTVHRLATALESHDLVQRTTEGRFELGGRLNELATARGQDRLASAARDVLVTLRDRTDESAQLFRRQGELRQCIAVADRTSGLRDTVPLGALLPLTAGSAAQVLLAWEPADSVAHLMTSAAFSPATLGSVRERGWAQSVEEREAGVASVSVPLRSPAGRVVAAVSVSGPRERLGDEPGQSYAGALIDAASDLSDRAFSAH